MSFLQPLALGFLLTLPIIVLLHMLRVRRREFRVSSVYFWLQAMRDTREQPRLRRPPVTLLLILQLLIATLATLALSRPMLFGPLAGGDYQVSHTMVLVDASASMQATDVASSRFAVARGQAEGLLNTLDPAANVTLIRMGVTPKVVYSGEDIGLARAALSGLQPGGGSANLREAMRLASSLVTPGVRNRIVVVSDLTFGPEQQDLRQLGQIPASVEYLTTGGPTANRAITLLAARLMPGSTTRYQLLTRVSNFAPDPATPTLRILADGLPLETRQLRLNAGAFQDLRWDLPVGTSRVELRITGDDALPADDTAQIVLPAANSRRLVLVSAQPDVLKRALAAVTGAEVLVYSPTTYVPDASAAVTVFEGFLPPQLPPGAVFAIHPPANNPIVPAAGDSPNTAIARVQGNSRLLDAVDLSSVTISQAQKIPLPEWATEVIGADAGPLLFEGVLRTTPMVVMPFNLKESNLASRVGFPILISNIINHLAPEGLPPVAEPGQPVVLRAGPQVASVTVQQPSGAAERFAGGGTIIFANTEEWGRYTVTETPTSGAAARERVFTVNAGNDVESDLRTPREPRVLAAPPGQVASGPTRGREIWPLLAALALVTLIVEWWVAHR
jgi:Ca-activated chloride channel homolog